MPSRNFSRSVLAVIVLILVVAGVFRPTLANQFVDWDDRNEIFQNPDFNPVTAKGLLWNWSHTRLSLYMPVTYMTWGLVAAISSRGFDGALSPAWFHGLNLALHAVCAVLVFLLILQLWHRRWPAFLGAMVFAVHPLQVEAVAWASGMYTLLSTALSLAALVAYVAFASSAEQRRGQDPTPGVLADTQLSWRGSWMSEAGSCTSLLPFIVATALYGVALLTKAASVSLPLAAAVIDLLIIRRSWQKMLLPAAFWILLGIPIVLIAKYFQDVAGIPTPPLWARPVVAMDAIGFYLKKMVLPVRLIPDYGRNPNWVMQHPPAVSFSVAIAMAALLCAWLARRNLKWITAAVGLILAGIAPYLGLTTFDFQYVSTVADRYAYFGMLGLSIFASAAAIRWRLAGICAIFAIVFWSILSFAQVRRWHDTAALFGYTLTVNAGSLVSHNVFGYRAAHSIPPDPTAAEAHYLAALRIWPEDAVIHFNLGNLYFENRPRQALQQYELAVKYQPRFVMYRNNLAVILDRLGRPAEAATQWTQAISDDPIYLDARNNLADLCLRQHQPEMARSQYQAVLRIDRGNVHAQSKLRDMTNDAKRVRDAAK